MGDILEHIKNNNVQTRSGDKVVILQTDRDIRYPIIGAVYDEFSWRLETWSEDGICYLSKPELKGKDLVPISEEKTVWLNCYLSGYYESFPTKITADKHVATTGRREACVKVTYKVGQFDE